MNSLVSISIQGILSAYESLLSKWNHSSFRYWHFFSLLVLNCKFQVKLALIGFRTYPMHKRKCRLTLKVHEGSFLALWNLKIWLEEKMLLVITFVTYDSQQFKKGIEKHLIASFHEFSMPKRVETILKTRKITIVAPFSVMNS